MENADSVLIQHINDSDTRNSLKTDRKQHRSYKGKWTKLPQFIDEKNAIPPSKHLIVLRKETITKSTLKNQLRTRCRLKNEISEAVVPSWSSFHKKTCVTSAKKASASYLPGITDSPTKFGVVQCIMQRTLECMRCLNLNYKFLEVDQAIYNKVL